MVCLKKLSRNNISFRKDTEKKYAITSEKLEINSGLKKKCTIVSCTINSLKVHEMPCTK